MFLPSILLAISALGLIAALARPGLSDLVLVAGPMVVASLWLLWQARRLPEEPAARERHVVIDGSNLLYWYNEKPDLMPVRAAISVMQARGFVPGVVFDTHVGAKIGAQDQDDRSLAEQLALPPDRVLVVPRGIPADHCILQVARDLSAPVVTNDQFRDWVADFPEFTQPGRLIRGGYRNGDLWLGAQG